MNEFLCAEEINEMAVSLEGVLSDAPDRDPIELLCKIKPLLIVALRIALLFVGKKAKEVIKEIIKWLKEVCDDPE